MPQFISKEEHKTPGSFTCRDSQTATTDFNVFDLVQKNTTVTALKTAYLHNLTISAVPTKPTKQYLQLKITEEETTTLISIAAKLASVATCTSLLYAFHANRALQKHTEDPGTLLATLIDTQNALATAN